MKVARIRRVLPLGLLLSFPVVAVVGCGGDTDSAGGPDVPAEEVPAKEVAATGDAGDADGGTGATQADVLHLCDKVGVSYTGRVYGNRMGKLFQASGVVWDDRAFSVDDRYLMDEGTDIQKERTVKVAGTISADWKMLERVVFTVTDRGPREGREETEQLTWTDLPLSWQHETMRDDWKTNPRSGYSVDLERDQIASHVEGWQSKTREADGHEYGNGQEELLSLFVPGEEATFEIEITFSLSDQ
jgi:hypothetical protein